MAGTMTPAAKPAALSITEPVRLTRSSLIGQTVRIHKTYGATVLGISIYLAYHHALGCRDQTLAIALTNALARGASGFDPTSSDERRCSRSYYHRRGLSWLDRERLEVEGRREAGERLEMFMRRQA
jgi:hypothetical protein